MTTSSLADVTSRFKAAGHPARLRILAMLRGGELCVCQITAVLGLANSTVSAHLAALRRAGLVEERKTGRWVMVSLPSGGAAGELLPVLWRQLEGDRRVAADEAVLRELRAVDPEVLCRADLDLERLGIGMASEGTEKTG